MEVDSLSKDIRKLILVFLIVFAIFTCLVVVSEIINYRQILNTYPEKMHIAVPDVVTVTMPS